MTLPIVERELRIASRHWRTYCERFVWGVLSMIVVGFVLSETWRGPQDQQGRAIFYTLSGFAFFYTIVAGILLTADSVSEEKREGTLGLLFLTNLKGYDVILGKLTSRSLHAVYGIITIFPIMAIAFLMGGVRLEEMGRMVLLLLNTLFFSLSLGMVVSTLSRVEMRARIAVFLILATINLVFPSVVAAFQNDMPPWARTLLFNSNPVYGWSSGFSNFPRQSLRPFWTNQAAMHLLGWLFLAIASFLASTVWKDKATSGAFTSFGKRLKTWRAGNASVQAGYRKRLLDVNPITWLCNRNPLAKWYPLIFLFGCLGIYGAGYLKFGNDVLEEGIIIMYGLTIHTIFKLWAIVDSVRLFTDSKKNGALDLIISTPMKVGEIIFGYWNGLVYNFRWGIFFVVLSDLLLVAYSGNNDPEWIFVCFIGIILLVVDMMTIGWVGMWLSLSRKSVNAILSTGFYILLLPWISFFLLMMGGSGYGFGFTEVVLAYLTISLLIDFVFYTWSSSFLKNEFRTLVAHQFKGTGRKV